MDPVRFRDCACPGTPHAEGDTVTFKEKLSFDENVAALTAIFAPGPRSGQAQNALPVYLHAVVEWNLRGENGKNLDLTAEALDELPFVDQWSIGNHGDTLYRDTVISPLVEPTRKSSRTSPTTRTPRRRSTS